MRVFLHEFVTGGGWYTRESSLPPPSLAAEGFAMLSALAADFARIDGVSVDLLRDARRREPDFPGCSVHKIDSAAEERQAIESLAAAAEWTIVVAPEFDSLLLERCLLVERAGGRLLGPGPRLVALASDKHATAEYLARHGVRVPRGIALGSGQRLSHDLSYPAVLKPRDGAGSQGIHLVQDFAAARNLRIDAPARVEEFCPGIPASVAVLCGRERIVPLVPCRQRVDVEQGFAYLGGTLPLPPALAERASRLATKVVQSLDHPRGYLGIDLVLGDDSSGARDVAIEINPRLTTSYVGLRALCKSNLAEAMLATAEGREVELCWDAGPIQFESSGAVRRAIASGEA